MARVLSQGTLDEIEKITKRYPTKQAATLPALHLAQKEQGYLSEEVQLDVADALQIAPTLVREVVTFYTMYYDKPVGRHIVKVCRSLSCRARGSEKIMAKAEEVLGIKAGETTSDGRITLQHEECLASCGTGPAVWCDDNVVENLDEKKIEDFLAGLK
ncbi:NAD(P)H-dependent oxidoreductase subunit E [Myxococcota bacterium]|nr:NAD(P)H-dependent oxidoreductase subunit E [Myxococcota bacterium]